MRARWKTVFVLCLLAVVSASGIFLLGSRFRTGLQAAENGKPFAMGIAIGGSAWEEDEVWARVWWHQDIENGLFQLFLPAAAREKAELVLQGTDHILLDGKKREAGKQLYLEEGAHQVTDPVSGAVYPLQVYYSEQLPAVFIETESGSSMGIHSDKAVTEKGRYKILSAENAGGGNALYKGELEAIGCRGNASFVNTDKKSYTLTMDQKTDLFGMGADRKWVLLANAFDFTMLRNDVALQIADSLQLAYTPESVHVELYLNGEYRGSYVLAEKIRVSPERVAIAELEKATELANENILLNTFEQFISDPVDGLYSRKGFYIPQNPTDITGGYLLEVELSDRYGLESSGFITQGGQAVVIQSPEYATKEQVDYISTCYKQMENAVLSPDGIDPESGRHYTEILDLDSFARKYLVEEVTMNMDAWYTSQYFYKPADQVSTKIFAGPAWDYDKSLKVVSEIEGIDLTDPTQFFANQKLKETSLWYGLYQKPEFVQRVREIYKELYPMLQQLTQEGIPSAARQLESSVLMDAMRWHVWHEIPQLEDKTERYAKEVEELRRFLEERSAFLAGEWLLE